MQEKEDLAGFRDALLVQYRERYLALKRSVDEDLADIITARRLEVESIVHRLHRSAADRLREGRLDNRRYAERCIRKCRAALQNDFVERLEKAIALRAAVFRSSERYGDAMNVLTSEALERFEGSAIALVEKGDAVFLKPSDRVREVREDLKDAWGGVVLLEREKGRRVDNTLRTRWKRLCPAFLSDFHERMRSLPDASFDEF